MKQAVPEDCETVQAYIINNADCEMRRLAVTSSQFCLHSALRGNCRVWPKNKDASKYCGNSKPSSSAIRPHIKLIFQWWDIGGWRGRETLIYYPWTLTERLKMHQGKMTFSRYELRMPYRSETLSWGAMRSHNRTLHLTSLTLSRTSYYAFPRTKPLLPTYKLFANTIPTKITSSFSADIRSKNEN